jgi:uncharacterized membrane protein YjjB (DUF3815 family)
MMLRRCLLVLILLGLAALPLAASAGAVATRCRAAPGVAPPQGQPPVVKVDGAPNPTTIRFGRGRDPITRTALLPVLGDKRLAPALPLATLMSDFSQTDGTALGRLQVTSRATTTNSGHQVRVAVCIDPSAGHHPAQAGTYVGSVTLDDPRVTAAAFPITVTLQSDALRPFLFCLVGAVAGWGWSLLIAQAFDLRTRLEKMRLAAVCIGSTVLGTFPIYLTLYAKDPGFVGDWPALWPLAAKAFVTATAAFPSLAALARIIRAPVSAASPPSQRLPSDLDLRTEPTRTGPDVP